MPDALVHLARERGVATITLDSRHNRNALSRQLVGELKAHLDAALADDGVRVIVLEATGPVFCAGADLKEARSRNEEQKGGGGNTFVEILSDVWHSPKPVVARVQGAARAGGIGLIAACDISIAVEEASFGFSEVRIGVAPAIISVVVLPKIGITRGMEYFLTGNVFDARAAAGMGLITRAVAVEELDATVAEYVEALRAGGPIALGACKRLVREVPGLTLGDGFAMMAPFSAELFASEEAREGLSAFAEKRQPGWMETRA